MSGTPPYEERASLDGDLEWIEDAARRFHRSRDWLEKQIKEGKLREYRIAGDRRKYVSKRAIQKLLEPRQGE
jgi:hypothetical protein